MVRLPSRCLFILTCRHGASSVLWCLAFGGIAIVAQCSRRNMPEWCMLSWHSTCVAGQYGSVVQRECVELTVLIEMRINLGCWALEHTILEAIMPRALDVKFLHDSIVVSLECYWLIWISEPHVRSFNGSSHSLGSSVFLHKVTLLPRLGLGTTVNTY